MPDIRKKVSEATNDPYLGVIAKKGILSFAHSSEKHRLRVVARH
jgi:hypothetical protein